jgi:hypothetical protein
MYLDERPAAGNFFSGVSQQSPGEVRSNERSLYDWLIKIGMSPFKALELVQQLRKVPSPPSGPGPNARGSVRYRPGYGPMRPLSKGQSLPAESIYRKKRGW